jgi:hypothetical protein
LVSDFSDSDSELDSDDEDVFEDLLSFFSSLGLLRFDLELELDDELLEESESLNKSKQN